MRLLATLIPPPSLCAVPARQREARKRNLSSISNPIHLVGVSERTQDCATLHNRYQGHKLCSQCHEIFPTTAITLPDYSIKQRGRMFAFLPSLFWLTNAAVTQCHFRCELDSDPMVGRSATHTFNVDPGNVVHL